MEFGYQMLKDNGDAWCKSQGIDFWNYGAEQGGWAATTTVNGRKAMIWQFLVQLAFAKRVSLVAAFTAKIRGGEVQVPAMTFKPRGPAAEPPRHRSRQERAARRRRRFVRRLHVFRGLLGRGESTCSPAKSR